MKLAYSACVALVLTVIGLTLVGIGVGHADDCPCSGSGNFCGWLFQPTATQATDGLFDEEIEIQWCFENNPTGGIVQFVANESSNIKSGTVSYTPDQFDADCSGTQVVLAEGELQNHGSDGLLVTRGLIGPFPGCGQTVDKELAINH